MVISFNKMIRSYPWWFRCQILKIIPLHLENHRVLEQVYLKIEDLQARLRYPSLDSVLDPFVKLSLVDMLKCTKHTRFMIWFLVFMNNRSKQVYIYYMYSRCFLFIHTCFNLVNKLILTILFMFWKNQSLIKILVLFLIKLARHKNELIWLIYVLKLLSQV